MSHAVMDDERRQFYRHPIDVPIQIFPQDKDGAPAPMSDLSEGGLAFQTNVFIEQGKMLKVHIPYVDPPFDAACVVRWHRQLSEGGFEVGVMFLDEETAFRIRMVEQVCHIKQYQKQEKENGRELTFQQAANEWIEKFAADFGRA